LLLPHAAALAMTSAIAAIARSFEVIGQPYARRWVAAQVKDARLARRAGRAPARRQRPGAAAYCTDEHRPGTRRSFTAR
jgi:hypothetical protein